MPTGHYIRPKRKPIYVIGPSIAYIPLTRGLYAVVDTGDAESVSQFNWNAKLSKSSGFYAETALPRAYPKSPQKRIEMHRFILDSGKLMTDHINQCGLHNFRGNLRPATRSVNCTNSSRAHRDSKSGIRGVTVSPYGKFQVFHLGRYYATFDEVEEARKFYASLREERLALLIAQEKPCPSK